MKTRRPRADGKDMLHDLAALAPALPFVVIALGVLTMLYVLASHTKRERDVAELRESVLRLRQQYEERLARLQGRLLEPEVVGVDPAEDEEAQPIEVEAVEVAAEREPNAAQRKAA